MKIRVKTVVFGLLVLMLVLAIGAVSAIGWQVVLGPDARPLTDRRFEASEARLARGKYLAEGPAHCFDCHSDRDLAAPGAPIIEARKGAGWVMPIPELNNIAAPNITPDVETGIGGWTDDEVARAIREGVRKDGAALFPVMPYLNFAALDDEDLASIVVYIRTLAPVRNTVPSRALPFPLEYIVKTMPVPITAPQPSHPSATPVERGRYMMTVANCEVCHTPTDMQGMPLAGLAFAGGGVAFADPTPGARYPVAANITPDASGIAHYDLNLFMNTLRTGEMGGRRLTPVMPFQSYKHMTDEDLADVFAYLRSVPPIKHRVNNTDPPTPCPICLQPHGLGELNPAPAGR